MASVIDTITHMHRYVLDGDLLDDKNCVIIEDIANSIWKIKFFRKKRSVWATIFSDTGNVRFYTASYAVTLSVPRNWPSLVNTTMSGDIHCYRMGKNYESKEFLICGTNFKNEFAMVILIDEKYATYATNCRWSLNDNRISTTLFNEPDELSDGILVVDCKKLYVDKKLLARHSPFFQKLFFGEFAEKEQEECTVEGVALDQFVEFLSFLYPGNRSVSEHNFVFLLDLADRFDAVEVTRRCADFIKYDADMLVPEKLRLADRYRLTDLEDHLMEDVTRDTITSIGVNNANMFTDRLLARLFRKMHDVSFF